MSNQYIAQGILLYSTLYVSTILALITFLTGRWIFLFFIILTFALVAYLSYLTAHDSENLKMVGKWAEDTIGKFYTKISQLI